jgi:hypothetical protein
MLHGTHPPLRRRERRRAARSNVYRADDALAVPRARVNNTVLYEQRFA